MPKKTEITVKGKENVIDEQTIKDYLFGSDTKLNEKQQALFINIAKSFNLNPFKREIYAIPYERNVNTNGKREKVQDIQIITGYQVYIEKAEQTWLLDWWNVEIKKENGKVSWAEITIYRKDFNHPFKRYVWINEFMKTNRDWEPISSWKIMPEFMIKKIAIGQGFRLAFPSHLNGMPYLQEEISEHADNVNVPKKTEITEAKIIEQEKIETPKNNNVINEIFPDFKDNKFVQEIEKKVTDETSEWELVLMIQNTISKEKIEKWTADHTALSEFFTYYKKSKWR